MNKNIYKSLKRINNTSNISLKYISLLSKINYESLRSKIRNNYELNESEIYQITLNYNMTLKQLEELKRKEKYHKMIDNKYYWNIIYYVNKSIISKQMGLERISSILRNGDGNYSYYGKELTFTPIYNINDYLKYSTSLVIVNHYKKIHYNPLDPIQSSIDEEISVINRCVSKINESFSKDTLKDIFIHKYVLGNDSKKIQNTLGLSRNRYYRLLAQTNEIAYKTFGLYTSHEIERKLSCLSNT